METTNSLDLIYHRGIRPKPPRVEAVARMLPPDPEAIATANFWTISTTGSTSDDRIQSASTARSQGLFGQKLFWKFCRLVGHTAAVRQEGKKKIAREISTTIFNPTLRPSYWRTLQRQMNAKVKTDGKKRKLFLYLWNFFAAPTLNACVFLSLCKTLYNHVVQV